MPRLAIVTGANKGIGYATVKLLSERLAKPEEWTIYLTARNTDLGDAAVKALQPNSKAKIECQQLDISSLDSIKRFAEHVKKNTGGVDILVNNAGVAYPQESTVPAWEQSVNTNAVNFFGTLDMCEAFIPLMKFNSRIVTVTSFVSIMYLTQLSPELIAKFQGPMTLEELRKETDRFNQLMKDDKVVGSGYLPSAYGYSKLAATKMTLIIGEQLANDPRNIVINACDPGYVDTDMTKGKGPKTPEEGADNSVYLALLPLDDPTVPKGQYVSERKVEPFAPNPNIKIPS